MEGYVDIHNHILPQIDDGSHSIEQTIRMLNTAYNEGIRVIIATPHYKEGRYQKKVAKLEATLNCVKDEIKDTLPELELYLGSEIYYRHECISLLEQKQIPTLAGSRYILVEYSPGVEFNYLKNSLQKCLFAGYLPILAHIERYKCLEQDIDLVEELIDMGAYMQINASSLAGGFGCKTKRLAKKLLKRNIVNLIATDAHNEANRPLTIKECVKYINKKYGQSYVIKFFIENPRKIINDEYI